MEKLVKTATLTMLLACSSSFAALTVLEDFEALTPGIIDMQHEIDEWGYPIELWNTQANRAERHPNEWSKVVENAGQGGGQCMQMTNRGHLNEVDTVYTCFYFGYDNKITDQGTVYMQFKSDQANDNVMGFNDLQPGYPSDYLGDSIEDDNYQGAGDWQSQATDIRLSVDEPLRCRNGVTGYESYDMGLVANTWYELWVHFDCPAKKVMFYVCEGGQTPQQVPSPDGTGWWPWWNGDHTNTAIQNIKWHHGVHPWPLPDDPTERNTWIDNIAVDTEGHSLTSFFVNDQPHPGDVDKNGKVDIYDFLTLRSNYGTKTGATWEMGDMDGNGTVDIYDFLILRANYGWVSSN